MVLAWGSFIVVVFGTIGDAPFKTSPEYTFCVMKGGARRWGVARFRGDFGGNLGSNLPVTLKCLSISFAFNVVTIRNNLPIFATILVSVAGLASTNRFTKLSLVLTNNTCLRVTLARLIVGVHCTLVSISLSRGLRGDMGLLSQFLVTFDGASRVFTMTSNRGKRINGGCVCKLTLLPVIK